MDIARDTSAALDSFAPLSRTSFAFEECASRVCRDARAWLATRPGSPLAAYLVAHTYGIHAGSVVAF